jgi:hypothetical protein
MLTPSMILYQMASLSDGQSQKSSAGSDGVKS